jgi:hypothetical protein
MTLVEIGCSRKMVVGVTPERLTLEVQVESTPKMANCGWRILDGSLKKLWPNRCGEILMSHWPMVV